MCKTPRYEIWQGGNIQMWANTLKEAKADLAKYFSDSNAYIVDSKTGQEYYN